MNFILREPTEFTRQGYSRKLKFIMRVSCVYIVLSLTAIGFCAAHASYSQPAEKRMTKIAMENESLKALISKMKEQTGLTFFYPGEVDEFRNITLPKADRTVKEVLDLVLKGTGLNYRVKDNTIFIYVEDNEKEEEKDEATEENDLSNNNFQMKVEGIVRDSNNTPMAGVNIIVKGTTNGTTTDIEGKYSINANDNDVLVFTFIGFKSFEAQVSGRMVIDVTMEEDIKSLQEVEVNAGYWHVKQREQTGNIAKVTSKEIERQPVSDPLATLQGRVPGLAITQQTGTPGGNFQVRIRGQNSIASGNDPLYIIDGVPYLSGGTGVGETSSALFVNGLSPLNSINPADIESVEILKDADATTIYGSRGANGVILITTKKGKAGKTTVDVNFHNGVGEITRTMKLLNTEQYLEMRREAFANDGVTPNQINAPDLVRWDTTRYTDWQKELIGGTAKITNAQLSISGGNENTQYILGGGYRKETSVLPVDGAGQRVSGHFKLTNASLVDKLKTSFSVNYAVNTTNLINQDITFQAAVVPPNAPAVFTENGELNWENNTWNNNPWALLRRKFKNNTNNLIANVVVGYNILPGLEIKANLGYVNRNDKAISKTPSNTWRPSLQAFLSNQTAFSNSNFQSWIIEPQLNWERTIGESKLSVLVGTTFQDQQTEALGLIAIGFASEALMENISSASQIFTGTDSYAQYRYNAIFSRVNYSWNQKYIINLTGRRDGSSRFGPNRHFANFGAVGAAWIFSNEDFIKNSLPLISLGKIRASYGITGNDQIGDYQFLNTYASSGLYQGVTGLVPTRLYNPDFAWETNKKLEIAIELGLIEDRIIFSSSYYQNRSSNQLVGTPLPPTTGFSSIISNRDASVQNTGLELDLTSANIETQNFSWITTANLTIPRNKLLSYPNLDASPDRNRLVIGESLYIRKLYNYLRVDPTTGKYEFEDVNEDGLLTMDDQQTIREVGQEFFGGLNNSIQYKGFQLDFLIQFVKQTGANYLNFLGSPPGSQFNQPVKVMDRWQQPGDVTDIQRFNGDFSLSSSYSNVGRSDLAISDASFIRLKNVVLSYRLPTGLLNKFGVDNLRFSLQGQNLLTLTNYEGTDPENLAVSKLPPLRMLTGGVNITF